MAELVDNAAEKQQKPRGRPFKSGQSGNPAGKKPGTISITAKIKKELGKIPENQKITYLDILVKKILKKAIVDEDKETIKLIWNYVDGMPKQAQEIEYKGEMHRIINIILNGKVEDELGEELRKVRHSTQTIPTRIPDE